MKRANLARDGVSHIYNAFYQLVRSHVPHRYWKNMFYNYRLRKEDPHPTRFMRLDPFVSADRELTPVVWVYYDQKTQTFSVAQALATTRIFQSTATPKLEILTSLVYNSAKFPMTDLFAVSKLVSDFGEESLSSENGSVDEGDLSMRDDA